jgi:YhcN/YlaJ family sporulation lipoprotein
MKWKLFSVLMVLVLALVACGTTNGNEEGRADRNNNNVENTRYNNNAGDGMTNDRDHTLIRNSERDQNGNRHDRNNMNNRDTNYDVSKEAADRITEEIDDIDHAYVLTTKNNAYVAADLDADHRDHNKDKAGDRKLNNDNNNNMNNNNMNNNNDRNGVNDELSDKVKEEIGDIVKSVDNDIDNVYVSTDPDFLNLTNNYVDEMNNGHPIEGFFDQFGNMIERLFPQNRR